jgi:ADP-heptose:LPS heptosyltransferase
VAIEGVDLNLVGKISFLEAAAVLERARLHIDGESGLVHLRHLLGGRSVVMFGPTPAEYFAYADNCNIVSKDCRGCMWMTDDWFEVCPRGLAESRCMASIATTEVLKDVIGVLQIGYLKRQMPNLHDFLPKR